MKKYTKVWIYKSKNGLYRVAGVRAGEKLPFILTNGHRLHEAAVAAKKSLANA